MIITSLSLFDGRLYDQKAKSNETELKSLLKHLLIDEEKKQSVSLPEISETTSKGGFNPVWRTYAKPKSKQKGPKLFKL